MGRVGNSPEPIRPPPPPNRGGGGGGGVINSPAKGGGGGGGGWGGGGVGPGRYRPLHHRPPTRIGNPRFLSYIASYDVVSSICLAHCPPRH